MPKLNELTAKEITEKIREKKATAEECVLSVFERIHGVEDRVRGRLAYRNANFGSAAS